MFTEFSDLENYRPARPVILRVRLGVLSSRTFLVNSSNERSKSLHQACLLDSCPPTSLCHRQAPIDSSLALNVDAIQVIYPACRACVAYNSTEHRQRFNLDHTDDICSFAMHPSGRLAATGEVKISTKDAFMQEDFATITGEKLKALLRLRVSNDLLMKKAKTVRLTSDEVTIASHAGSYFIRVMFPRHDEFENLRRCPEDSHPTFRVEECIISEQCFLCLLLYWIPHFFEPTRGRSPPLC